MEAPAAQRPVLDRLLQLYLHDFSEFAPIGSPHGDVDAEGRFTYPRVESYWQQIGHIPLLIRADDHLAGFALVNQWSALELPLDHSVAEFFVMRKYRRARVGTRAALLIFRRYPGRWGSARWPGTTRLPWRSGAVSQKRRLPGRWRRSPETANVGPARCCAL